MRVQALDQAAVSVNGPVAQSWVRDAVIYQVYVRSFADSDGDGVGDLPGVISRLDYLAELGVDAVWLTPFYTSPMADGGYDVADYRDVDPSLGSLADFDRLVELAHRRGLKIVIDLVPNHCSERHPWFRQAIAAGPGSPQRQLFHFRSGATAPNNWQSVFGGPAWTQLPDGDWYLHLFAPEQPDFNWEHPQVRAEFADILRFWLDRGVDGIRIDVAHGMIKAAGLPDASDSEIGLLDGTSQPFFDQDGVHEIYRQWRSILDDYQPERVAVAEAWLPSLERNALYVRPDELHQAFNFELLGTGWSGVKYRQVIEASLAAMASVGAAPTWVMSNHDVVRHASRLAAGTGGVAGGAGRAPEQDAAAAALGLRRARAALLLLLALPGSAYLYQGEELGLPEVFDLPMPLRQDPIVARTGGAQLGRDGCRVPLPWSGSQAPFGFGPQGTRPWLPQPGNWAGLTVQAQREDPNSTLLLYVRALQLRRRLLGPSGLGGAALRWLSSPDDDLLVFQRGDSPRLICAVNLGSKPAVLPDQACGEPIVISNGRVGPGGTLAGDTGAWWLAAS